MRFHLRSTVRVTLRNTAVQATVAAVAVGLLPDPGEVLVAVARSLRSGGLGAFLGVALWAGWNAVAATKPLASSLRGWHRHLPSRFEDQRRVAVLAVWLCQAPVLAVAGVLWLAACCLDGFGPWPVPLALAVLGPALATLVLPGQRWSGRLLAAIALAATSTMTWTGIAVAGAALVLHDRTTGPLLNGSTSVRERRHSRLGGGLLPWRIDLRAVGRKVPGTWLTAALVLAAAWLFLHNNTLRPDEQATGVRFGGGLALLAVVLGVAGELAARRPPWSWARSLPWSSRRRVAMDAGFLIFCALPPLIGAALLCLPAAPPLAAVLVYQSLRLADACRRDAGGVTRLGASAVVEACLVQTTVALSGWFALAWLALTPVALRLGERREQGRKVSVWHERHRLDWGDLAT